LAEKGGAVISKVNRWLHEFTLDLTGFADYGSAPHRYRRLRRNMIILGMLGSMLPLLLMAVVNYHQYQGALKNEVVQPMRALVNKTKHSFELFLTERLSAVSFIASAYTFQELADEPTLNRIFRVMKKEFGGFVDLGLIDSAGIQVSYAGPYQLKGKDYAEQGWFQEVKVRGSYISDVFLGYRKFPHLIIAVAHTTGTGESWILRATIDTDKFNNLIASMGLEPTTDAFLVNSDWILQTPTKFHGKVLDVCALPYPPISYEPNVIETWDFDGNEVLMAYTFFVSPQFVLAVVKPRGEVLKPWFTLKSELFFILIAGVVLICLALFKVTDVMVKRMEESDQKREAALHGMEYSNKLASIGRLAAGVAHEINNPLAIINEKGGLMRDLIEFNSNFPDRDKFLSLTDSIVQSVERCRAVTHRLLGFARRMDVEVEVLELNEVLREVMGFLEKEALHRNIDVRLQLAGDLPRIASDRGQLQQVFLNILNNAFQAVDDGGIVTFTSWDRDPDTVGVSVQDNGKGMSEETLKHVFEPFFTTKKGSGTGLGLSITYGIVKKLGGDIEVHSREGQGTTFTVFLPKKAKPGTGA
jgi:two-component system, NtrC family, sensor kinase